MKIGIKAKTVTPLRQIAGTSDDVIRIKREAVQVASGDKVKRIELPVYTGNGLRGLLRREATAIILEKATQKGIKIDPVDFHLMNAGGGNNYQSQSYDIEKQVRLLNPLVSMLGTSLAVAGKIGVSSLIPMQETADGLSYAIREMEDGRMFSSVLEVENIIKKDDLLDRTANSRFLSEDELVAWNELVAENQTARAVDRADTDKAKKEKVKKQSIKHFQGREAIITGAELYGSITLINDVVPLTDIELGLLYRTLERMTERTLGSNANTGNGKVDYVFTLEDGSEDGTPFIVSEFDARKVNVTKHLSYTKEQLKCVKAFDEWLKDLSAENIELTKILQ